MLLVFNECPLKSKARKNMQTRETGFCLHCYSFDDIVANQLLHVRLHECYRRPVAVIPPRSHPQTLTRERKNLPLLPVGLKLSLCCVGSLFSLSPLRCLSISTQSSTPLHAVPFLSRTPRRYAHTHDNLSLTQRPVQTIGATHEAK